MALSIESAVSVRPLIQQLGARDIHLSPNPGSHLDAIINSVASIEVTGTIEPSSDGLYDDIPADVVDLTIKADTVLDNKHAKSMANAVETLATKGEEIIQFVRGEVIPTLTTLVGRVVDEMKIRKAEGVRKYKIIPYRPADILFTETLQEILSNASPRHNAWGLKNEFKVSRWFPAMPIEDLLVVMRTENPSLNGLIDSAIQQYGEDCVQTAFDMFFNTSPATDRPIMYPNEIRSDQRHDGERLFAILLAIGLKDHPPSGVNVSLGELTSYLSDVIAFNASSLHRYMKNYATRAEKKFLDIHRREFNTTDVCFYVNDVAYDHWKNSKGLTDAAILGSMVSEGARDAEKIMEKKEYYESEWARQEKITARTIESNTEVAISSAIRDVVHVHARSVFGDSYLVESGRIDKKINTIFASGYKPKSDEDIYTSLREVVLCVFYPDEGVCIMLKSLDDIMKDSPGIDVRQAAGLAFIDLAVAWMLSQVSIS